jgi:hypothetical protein
VTSTIQVISAENIPFERWSTYELWAIAVGGAPGFYSHSETWQPTTNGTPINSTTVTISPAGQVLGATVFADPLGPGRAWEVVFTNSGTGNRLHAGNFISTNTFNDLGYAGDDSTSWYNSDGTIDDADGPSISASPWSDGDVIGIVWAGTFTGYFLNGVFQGQVYNLGAGEPSQVFAGVRPA